MQCYNPFRGLRLIGAAPASTHQGSLRKLKNENKTGAPGGSMLTHVIDPLDIDRSLTDFQNHQKMFKKNVAFFVLSR